MFSSYFDSEQEFSRLLIPVTSVFHKQLSRMNTSSLVYSSFAAVAGTFATMPDRCPDSYVGILVRIIAPYLIIGGRRQTWTSKRSKAVPPHNMLIPFGILTLTLTQRILTLIYSDQHRAYGFRNIELNSFTTLPADIFSNLPSLLTL